MTSERKSYLADPRAVSLHETFVRNVRERMVALGWVHPPGMGNTSGKPSIKLLAERAAIPYRTVENLMTLSNQPTMVGAAAIAQAIGVPLDELLGIPPTWGYRDVVLTTDKDGNPDRVERRLACIHTKRHEPGMAVCASCLAKWQEYQRRLNDLYTARRIDAAAQADARLQEQRIAARQQGIDPDDVQR